MSLHGRKPRGTDGSNGYIEFLRNPVVSIIELNLHGFVISNSVFWRTVAMCPGEEEKGSGANISDLFDKSSRCGVHRVSSGLLHCWDFALFLQNHIHPLFRIQRIERVS